MKRQDLYLLSFLVVVIGIFLWGYQTLNRGTGEEVVVYVGEEERTRFSLKDETTFVIGDAGEKYNRLEIRGGQADMTEASCPDQICVHQKPVSEIGETIVCMPNQVIITVESASQKKGE